MIGQNKDTEFDYENYEEFYSHHRFVPTSEEHATSIHELVPRFGWGYDMVEEYKPKTLLDLGTLDGSFPLTMAKHFGTKVTGVDLTKDGIELAQARAKVLGLDATFIQGTIEDALYKFIKEGTKFDMVTCFEVIEHVKDPELLLDLIDQVLAEDGYGLISTPDFESPLYGKDDEKNKCHIRLYTTAEEDYEAVNKYGNVRKATSMPKQFDEGRIKSIGVYSHLINVLYQ